MISPIFNGILTGAIISLFSFGTIFFLLIKIGMQDGFRKGALFELGHLCSLGVIIFAINFSLLNVDFFNKNKDVFCLVSGIIIVIFGIRTLIQHSQTPKHDEEEAHIEIPERTNPFRLISKGFLLNIINPFEFILWFSLMKAVDLKYQYSHREIMIYCMSALSALAFLDLTKVYFAKRIRNKITDHILSRIYKIIGIIIICFGGWLMCLFFIKY